jgi:hypothetical protein
VHPNDGTGAERPPRFAAPSIEIAAFGIGAGFQTRFALLNELLGPGLIGTTQTHLFNTVGADLSPPPGPPCKRLCNPE